MSASFRTLIAVVMLCALAACRQPDGEMPVPQGEDLNRIEDLANNLQNIGRGDPDGVQDLADDLSDLAGDNRDARPAAAELASRAATALQGRLLDKEPSLRLGEQLWLAAAARELSERQIEQLGVDIQNAFIAAGSDAAAAEAVGAQARVLQSAVTERPRRWYQLF